MVPQGILSHTEPGMMPESWPCVTPFFVSGGGQLMGQLMVQLMVQLMLQPQYPPMPGVLDGSQAIGPFSAP